MEATFLKLPSYFLTMQNRKIPFVKIYAIHPHCIHNLKECIHNLFSEPINFSSFNVISFHACEYIYMYFIY